MDCNKDEYNEWFDKIYDKDLYPSLIRDLVSAERSNKKLWEAMNFESSKKVRRGSALIKTSIVKMKRKSEFSPYIIVYRTFYRVWLIPRMDR